MATVPSITIIPKTECIGNSLVTINTNNENIRNSFNSVNADFASISNTLNTLTSFVNSVSSQQLAKAWVKFDPNLNFSGTTDSSLTPRRLYSSYNVSQVIRNSTGKYTVTFAAPLNDNHFVVQGMARPANTATGTTYTPIVNVDPDTIPSPANASCKIIIRNLEGAQIDPSFVYLAFFSN